MSPRVHDPSVDDPRCIELLDEGISFSEWLRTEKEVKAKPKQPRRGIPKPVRRGA